MKLWDAATGECTDTLVGHGGTVYALVVLPDGRLATASFDDKIKVWALAGSGGDDGGGGAAAASDAAGSGASGGATCVATLAGHTGTFYSLALLGDGRLASASDDYSVKL